MFAGLAQTMKNRKQLERRTFLQDRYDILYKKLKQGEASFAEMTELDDIVNRSAHIREQVLEQMHGMGDSSDDETSNNLPVEVIVKPQTLLEKAKLLLGKLFNLKIENSRTSLN